MGPRPSRRADGRGWSGRGDSGPRRRGHGEPDGAPAGGGDRHDRPVGDAGVDDLLRGHGDAPWVRFSDREPRAAADPRAPRAGPPLPDLSSLLLVLESVRGMVPRELSEQVNTLLRELLLTVRALVDWYLERLDDRPREREVEEIPID